MNHSLILSLDGKVNEAQIIHEAIRVAPALAILVWVMLRQERALKRVTDAYEGMAKSLATSLDKNTEMLGRNAAYLARASDIIDDLVEEKKRGCE